MLRTIHPLKIVLVAAVLGVVVGLGLAFRKQKVDDDELAAIRHRPKEMHQERFPAAAPPPTMPQLSSASRVDGRALEGIPPYPGADPRDLATSTMIQNPEEQAHVAWFTTPDTVDQVMSYYEQRFSDMGRLAVRHMFSPNAGYVGYLDPGETKDEKLHLISILRNRHETVVFPSTSYPGHFLDNGGGQLPSNMPAPPGIEGSVVFKFDEGGAARLSWHAQSGDTVANLTDFYRRALTEKGWTVGDVNTEKPGEVRIEASQGPQSVTVLLQQSEKGVSAKSSGKSVSIYVSMAGQS